MRISISGIFGLSARQNASHLSQLSRRYDMDNYTAVGIAEGFIEGTEPEQIEAWQYLHDTGLAYQLQGSFGRTAQSLLSQGIIS